MSEFAPSSIQKPLSYLAGWLAALTWQTYVATPAFQAAEITLVLAQVQNANYTPTAWQVEPQNHAHCVKHQTS